MGAIDDMLDTRETGKRWAVRWEERTAKLELERTLQNKREITRTS